MGWQDLMVSEDRQQEQLPKIPPPLRPLPRRILPLPRLRSIVRYPTNQNSTNLRTFFGLQFAPQIFIDWLSHLVEHEHTRKEIEIYTLPCRSSLVIHRIHHHITGDCIRLAEVCPIHRGENPTVRCSGWVSERSF